jgi:hypothetical protein
MATKEDYLRGHRRSGIKKGDMVKVTRIASDEEQGWDNSWTIVMDKLVGGIYEVTNDGEEYGFSIFDPDHGFEFGVPYFILEKQDSQPEVEMTCINCANISLLSLICRKMRSEVSEECFEPTKREGQ